MCVTFDTDCIPGIFARLQVFQSWRWLEFQSLVVRLCWCLFIICDATSHFESIRWVSHELTQLFYFIDMRTSGDWNSIRLQDCISKGDWSMIESWKCCSFQGFDSTLMLNTDCISYLAGMCGWPCGTYFSTMSIFRYFFQPLAPLSVPRGVPPYSPPPGDLSHLTRPKGLTNRYQLLGHMNARNPFSTKFWWSKLPVRDF